jgi:Flp pilus assembly protein TadD
MRLLAPLAGLCTLVLLAGCSHLPSFMRGHDEVKQYGADLGVGGVAPDEDKVRDFEKKLSGNEWKSVRAKREGWQLHRQGKIDEAIDRYKEALGYDQQDVEALTYIGRAYRDKGMLYQSARTLIRAVKTSPKNAEAHAQLGVTFDMQGNYSQAEQEHRRAVQLNPRGSQYHNNLGFCYFLQGRTKEAITELQAAIRANPEDRRAHNNLAYIYAAQGRFDSAFAELRQSGTEAEAYNNLGYLYFLKGKRQKAIESFEQALNLNYSLVAAQENLKAITMQGETAPPALGFDKSGPSPVLVEEDMDGPVPRDGLDAKPGAAQRDVSGTLLDGSLRDIPAVGRSAGTEEASDEP